MSERTVYTCDNCGYESSTKWEFLRIRLTREKLPADYAAKGSYGWKSNDVQLVFGLYCAKCCLEYFGLRLTPERVPSAENSAGKTSLLQRVVAFAKARGFR